MGGIEHLSEGLQDMTLAAPSPGPITCVPTFYPFKREHENIEMHSRMAADKFYVVKEGLKPGIYTQW